MPCGDIWKRFGQQIVQFSPNIQWQDLINVIYCELELLNKYFHSDISFLSLSPAHSGLLFSLLSSLAGPATQQLLNFTFKFHLPASNGKTLSYSLGMQIFHKQPITNNTQLKVWGHDGLNLNIMLKFLSIIFSCCHEIIQFSCSRYWILWILLKLLNIVQKF